MARQYTHLKEIEAEVFKLKADFGIALRFEISNSPLKAFQRVVMISAVAFTRRHCHNITASFQNPFCARFGQKVVYVIAEHKYNSLVAV